MTWVTLVPAIGRLAARPSRICKTGHAFTHEPPAPQQDCHPVDPKFGRNVLVHGAVGCRQDHSGSHRQPLFGRSGSHKALERCSLRLADDQ
jgi:hypothetical protein